MATDSQGRPLSDDGQWAWNGTEWVPAAAGAQAPQDSSAEADPGATMIAPSPLATGGPPAAAQPPAAQQPLYGGTPGYGAAPGGPVPVYGAPGGPAAGYGVPPQRPRSKKPIIFAIIGVLVIAAVVVVLVLTLGGKDSAAAPSGAFKCTTPGSSGSGVLTFQDGKKYAASNSEGGTWTQDDKKITFHGGDFDKASGTFDSGKKTFTFTLKGTTYTCKHS